MLEENYIQRYTVYVVFNVIECSYMKEMFPYLVSIFENDGLNAVLKHEVQSHHNKSRSLHRRRYVHDEILLFLYRSKCCKIVNSYAKRDLNGVGLYIQKKRYKRYEVFMSVKQTDMTRKQNQAKQDVLTPE